VRWCRAVVLVVGVDMCVVYLFLEGVCGLSREREGVACGLVGLTPFVLGPCI